MESWPKIRWISLICVCCLAEFNGESSASPHSKKQLTAARDLMRIYGMDFDVHASHGFERDEQTQDSN